MKKFCLGFNSVESISSFLNDMDNKGNELSEVKGFSLNFKKRTAAYRYLVYFIGYKREAELTSYLEELDRKSIEYFFYSFNHVKSNFGKIGGGKSREISNYDNTRDFIHRNEILIVKVPISMINSNDVILQMDKKDLYEQTNKLCSTYRSIVVILFVLLLFFIFMTFIPSFKLNFLFADICLFIFTAYYFRVLFCYKNIISSFKA